MLLLITAAITLLNPIPQARVQTNGGNYEDSLLLLKSYYPKQEEYNDYAYLKAVNHFALNEKKEAEKWIQNLEDSFNPLPRRYQAMINVMKEDIKIWKEGDLNDIVRDMKRSGTRLVNAKAGEKTQEVQKQVITKLDKLIKEQEDAKNNMNAKLNGKGDGSKNPQPGQGDKQSPDAATDSNVMGGNGEGKVDEKKLRQLADNWGTLPPEERAKAVMDVQRDLPAKYKPMIEEYFKSLNRMDKK